MKQVTRVDPTELQRRSDLATHYRNGARLALKDLAKGIASTTRPDEINHGLDEENGDAYRNGYMDQRRIFTREYPGE